MSGSAATLTYDLDILYNNVVTANGSFSFSSALLGQQVMAADLTSFTLTFDPGPSSQTSGTFSPIYDGSEGPPTAALPYFDFNSATDTLVQSTSGQLIEGGNSGGPDTFLDFGVETDVPLGEQYLFIQHLMAHGTFVTYGSFDQIVITPEAVACFATGTAIRAETGEIAVEALRIGDRVLTASGVLRPVTWIGHRSYAGRFLAGRRSLLPIRFQPGSLGAGVPRRALRVSPCHAMLLDGVLVPAACLVNGTTIVQEAACAQVEYWHVELERHDIVFAEGAAAESFVDDDSRFLFDNAHAAPAAHGRSAGPAVYCAPRIEAGFAVEAIRRRLADRGATAEAA